MKITEDSVMVPFENMMYYTFDRHMTDSSFRNVIERLVFVIGGKKLKLEFYYNSEDANGK